MNRKLKALGLALLAVLVVGAFSASAASAGTQFTSESNHTELKGSQVGTDEFIVNAGTVKCTEATYTGTNTGTTSSSITVAPTYSGCTAFGFVNATIDMNGCDYEFTTTATVNAVHIKCGANPIAVTAFNCEVTVPSQTVNGGITYHNSGGAGSAMDVEVTVALTGITYIQHSKSFPGCSTSGTGTATSLYHDGKYNGKATVQGTDTVGNPVGVTVS